MSEASAALPKREKFRDDIVINRGKKKKRLLPLPSYINTAIFLQIFHYLQHVSVLFIHANAKEHGFEWVVTLKYDYSVIVLHSEDDRKIPIKSSVVGVTEFRSILYRNTLRNALLNIIARYIYFISRIPGILINYFCDMGSVMQI